MVRDDRPPRGASSCSTRRSPTARRGSCSTSRGSTRSAGATASRCATGIESTYRWFLENHDHARGASARGRAGLTQKRPGRSEKHGGPRHRRRRVHRQRVRGAAPRRPARRSSCSTTSRAGTAARSTLAPSSRRAAPATGRSSRVSYGSTASTRALTSPPSPTSASRSPSPARYYENNFTQAAALFEALVEAGVRARGLLLDLRHLRRAARGADPGGPPAVADQPVRLVEAVRRAAAVRLRPRLRPALRGAALLQRRRGDARSAARPTRPRRTSSRSSSPRRPAAAGRSPSSATTTTRPTAPPSATTSTSRTSGRRISSRSPTCGGAARRSS